MPRPHRQSQEQTSRCPRNDILCPTLYYTHAQALGTRALLAPTKENYSTSQRHYWFSGKCWGPGAGAEMAHSRLGMDFFFFFFFYHTEDNVHTYLATPLPPKQRCSAVQALPSNLAQGCNAHSAHNFALIRSRACLHSKQVLFSPQALLWRVLTSLRLPNPQEKQKA